MRFLVVWPLEIFLMRDPKVHTGQDTLMISKAKIGIERENAPVELDSTRI